MADCIRHQMSDGTIMEGPIHGPGQVCIEYESNNGRNNMTYRRKARGTARRTPTRGMARRKPTRGVARRRPAPTRGVARRGASRVSSLRGTRGASQQYNPIQEANFINGAGVAYYCPPGKQYGSGFCVKKNPLDGQFTR